jgi:hypothetical protein
MNIALTVGMLYYKMGILLALKALTHGWHAFAGMMRLGYGHYCTVGIKTLLA